MCEAEECKGEDSSYGESFLEDLFPKRPEEAMTGACIECGKSFVKHLSPDEGFLDILLIVCDDDMCIQAFIGD